jgi:hypothetical protein
VVRKIAYILFFLFLIVKCSEPNKKKQGVAAVQNKTIRTKPGSSYYDTLIIHGTCALFYQPDSVQKEKIKALTEPGVFESSMHEFFYQQRNAHIFLKKYWPHLKIIEVQNKRFLIFVKDDRTSELTDLDKKNDSYGMFVFDGKQSPRQLDMMNVESQVPEYFSK